MRAAKSCTTSPPAQIVAVVGAARRAVDARAALARRELPALKELHSQLKDRGLNVIGVGVDTDGTKSAAMARKYGVDYPVILDPRGKILGLFDVKSMPTTYLIDRDGVIVDKLVGWGKTEEKLSKVIKKVEELL